MFFSANGWEFLPFRFWVAIWIGVVLLILVATDMSALVGLITRMVLHMDYARMSCLIDADILYI